MSQSASPVPEQTAVRWAARGGALVLAALVALIFLHPFAVATPGQRGDGASVVSVSIEAPQSAQQAQRPERPPPRTPITFAEANSTRPMSTGAPGEPYQLWTYSSGRIVFTNADQYERCRDARSRGSEAADCPPASDRHEMIMAANTGTPPLVILRRPITHGWR